MDRDELKVMDEVDLRLYRPNKRRRIKGDMTLVANVAVPGNVDRSMGFLKCFQTEDNCGSDYKLFVKGEKVPSEVEETWNILPDSHDGTLPPFTVKDYTWDPARYLHY